MHTRHKVNAAVVLLFAALFYWLFMFAKHDAALSKIIPFGDDPYDAVGSFAVVIGVLVALISLVRAFRPYRPPGASIENQVYLVRAQMCAVLVASVTLVSDGVALARHPSMWTVAPQRDEMFALFGGMAIVAVAVGRLILRSARGIVSDRTPAKWNRAAIVGLAAVIILAVYPERLIQQTLTHLLTVVAGALILFVPMRPLLTALVPYESRSAPREAPGGSPGFVRRHRWGIVVMVGVMLGLFFFAGEMSEGAGGIPLERIAAVALVFVGLSTTGLAIAYTFLGIPLGLVRRR
jgi:hypothetical protein